jgi:Flp pilus assembly protein TadB
VDADEEGQDLDRGSVEDEYRRELLRAREHRHASYMALTSGTMALLGMLAFLALGAAISGVMLLAGIAILALVVIAFYAFVFGRVLRLKAKRSREKAGIDLEIGKRS